MEYVVGFILGLFFSIVIAEKAEKRGRSNRLWFIFSVICSPIIAGIFLFTLKDLSLNKTFEKNTIKKQNILIGENYKIVTVITFFYSIFLLISTIIVFFEESSKQTFEGVIFYLITTTIIIYIYLKFKKLINKEYQNFNIDNIIYLLIISELMMLFLEILGYIYEVDFNKYHSTDFFIYFLCFVLVFIYGIVGLIYGLSLKKVSNNSDFKIYRILTIISSILMLTVIGALIAFILKAIAFFYLSIIFNKSTIIYEKNISEENTIEKNKIFTKNIKTENIVTKEPIDDYEKIKQEENKIRNPKSKIEAEIYFNSLQLNDYLHIKNEATKYLPVGLSEEEIKNVILDYIIRKCI